MITEKQKLIIKALMSKKEGCNINQIAKITNLSPSWTYETLKLLEKQGLLVSEKAGNAILFKINWNDLKAQKTAELIEIEDKPVNKKYLIEDKKEISTINENLSPQRVDFYSAPKQEQNSFSYSGAVQQNFSYSQNQQNSFSYSGQQGSNFYGVAPVGQQGVNAVLTQYAASGAFGNFYSQSQSSPRSSTQVPPSTLGSRISSNISGYNLSEHTSNHLSSSVSGCKYCGPGAKI